MTQPRFVPIAIEDEVRPGSRLGPPRAWTANRPADFRSGPPPSERGTGTAGPDQGYALLLAQRFANRPVLVSRERRDDVLAGAVGLAMKRAGLFGRAPMASDIECVLALFGFLAPAPSELVELRRDLFSGVGRDYWTQREFVDRFPESSLQRTRSEIVATTGDWRTFVGG